MTIASLHEECVDRAGDWVENALNPTATANAVLRVLELHTLEPVPDDGPYSVAGLRRCGACGWLEECGPCPTLKAIADALIGEPLP